MSSQHCTWAERCLRTYLSAGLTTPENADECLEEGSHVSLFGESKPSPESSHVGAARPWTCRASECSDWSPASDAPELPDSDPESVEYDASVSASSRAISIARKSDWLSIWMRWYLQSSQCMAASVVQAETKQRRRGRLHKPQQGRGRVPDVLVISVLIDLWIAAAQHQRRNAKAAPCAARTPPRLPAAV